MTYGLEACLVPELLALIFACNTRTLAQQLVFFYLFSFFVLCFIFLFLLLHYVFFLEEN